jgi:hypothetical protein
LYAVVFLERLSGERREAMPAQRKYVALFQVAPDIRLVVHLPALSAAAHGDLLVRWAAARMVARLFVDR